MVWVLKLVFRVFCQFYSCKFTTLILKCSNCECWTLKFIPRSHFIRKNLEKISKNDAVTHWIEWKQQQFPHLLNTNHHLYFLTSSSFYQAYDLLLRRCVSSLPRSFVSLSLFSLSLSAVLSAPDLHAEEEPGLWQIPTYSAPLYQHLPLSFLYIVLINSISAKTTHYFIFFLYRRAMPVRKY